MIISIYIEIGALFYYESRNRKLSRYSKLRTDSLRRCDVQFYLQKNTKNLKNDVKRR